MSVSSARRRWGRVTGNREVSCLALLLACDAFQAREKAHSEEGGSWGKHGFPLGNEPQASDAVER
jgi:hypothetical protein